MSEENKFNQTKGNIEETVGNAIGDKEMEKEGKKDKVTGKAKEYVDEVSDKANNAIDKITDKFKK